MDASNKSIVRYSDQELAEFKELIDGKLKKSKEELERLQDQILEITENGGDEFGGDYVDDSSFYTDMEMLNTMAIRQRKYIQDLENALVRIQLKTYGICKITEKLIDKKRLMAVPTTTKSLEAKNEEQRQKLRKSKTNSKISRNPYIKQKQSPTVISKVVRKSKATSVAPPPKLNDDEDEDDFETMDAFEENNVPDVKNSAINDFMEDMDIDDGLDTSNEEE